MGGMILVLGSIGDLNWDRSMDGCDGWMFCFFGLVYCLVMGVCVGAVLVGNGMES